MVSRSVVIIMIVVLIVAISDAPISMATLIENPHVDPDKIEERLDPISLVIIYINVLRGLSDLNLNESLIHVDILKNASVPYDIRLVMNKLNELISELALLINNTVYELNKTEEYLEENNIVEANKSISKAALYLFKANTTLNELLSAWYEFKRHLSMYVVHEYRPRFLEYTVQLELLFKRLDRLLNKLYELKQDLETKIVVSTMVSPNKINTSITIYYYNQSIHPGGILVLNGSLISEEGIPLANKRLRIYVYVQNKRLIEKEVFTNSQGIFYANITMPQTYYLWRAMKPGLVKFNSSIYVVYTPLTQDNYSGSHVILNTTYYYYRSKLKVIGKTTAYVGSNLTYKIKILPPNVAINRTLRIFLDSKNIANISLPLASSYRTIKIKLPSNISIGQHFINITLLGYKQFSLDSIRLPIIVQHIPIYVSVSYPQTIVYPIQRLRINGSITDYYGEPVVNATIIVGDERAFTNINGSFNMSISITSINIIGGLVVLNLTVKPVEPWYPVVNKTLRINYINLYTIVGITSYIAIAIIIAPTLVKINIYKRSRVEKKAIKISKMLRGPKLATIGEEEKIPGNILERMLAKRKASISISETALKMIKLEYRLKRNIIVDKLLEMLLVLGTKYSKPLSSETLREYVLRISRDMPRQIAEKVSLIITLVEKELYSKTELALDEKRKLMTLIEEVIDYVRRI